MKRHDFGPDRRRRQGQQNSHANLCFLAYVHHASKKLLPFWDILCNPRGCNLSLSRLCALMPDADSALFGLFRAPLVATTVCLCYMHITNSYFEGSLGTFCVTALLHLCTMRDTNSTVNGSLGKCLLWTALLHFHAMLGSKSCLFEFLLHPLFIPTPCTTV